MTESSVELKEVSVNGLSLAYREVGTGLPVLLLHGWPTSSFLWRNIMPYIAENRRVIALDLPGFGASDKPLDVVYDSEYYRQVIDGFLAELDIERLGLAVHDLGGARWLILGQSISGTGRATVDLKYNGLSRAFIGGQRLPRRL